MKTLVQILACSVLLAACAQAPLQTPLAADPARLEAHINFLASDNLQGRGTGTQGHEIAAEYVAAQFHQLGLTPAGGDDTFYQQVPLKARELAPDGAKLSITSLSGEHQLSYPDQFIMGGDPMLASQSVSGELVFASYGIVAPDYGHNDYAGLDVQGKIVVLLAGRPAAWPTEEGAHLASGGEKLRHAVENGAIGMIVLHTPREEKTFPYSLNVEYSGIPRMNWVGPDGLPDGYYPQIKGSAFLGIEAGEILFEGSVVPLSEIFQADLDQTEIKGFSLASTVQMSRESSFESLESPNVIALIEGSDPVLKNEYLVYTAHLDHLGVLPNEDGEMEIYNGALDNAAGVATLLETARVLSAERDKLKRSVMFLVVTGEEKGLLGAGYFAKNPTVPIESLVGNINLDMPVLTYPFADVVAFGAEHSSLKSYVESAASDAGIKLSPDPMPEQALFVRSDHYRLVQQGVPAVFLVTGFESQTAGEDGGEVYRHHLKTYYHKPSDDLQLPIDYEAGRVFTEINVNIGREISNSAERPRWNDGDFFGRTFAGGS